MVVGRGLGEGGRFGKGMTIMNDRAPPSLTHSARLGKVSPVLSFILFLRPIREQSGRVGRLIECGIRSSTYFFGATTGMYVLDNLFFYLSCADEGGDTHTSGNLAGWPAFTHPIIKWHLNRREAVLWMIRKCTPPTRCYG